MREENGTWICLAGCTSKTTKKLAVVDENHIVSAAHVKKTWDEATIMSSLRYYNLTPEETERFQVWHRRWGSGPYEQGPYFPIRVASLQVMGWSHIPCGSLGLVEQDSPTVTGVALQVGALGALAYGLHHVVGVVPTIGSAVVSSTIIAHALMSDVRLVVWGWKFLVLRAVVGSAVAGNL